MQTMSTYTLNIVTISSDDKDLYENHSFYNEGDSGLDLFCVTDQDIEPGLSRKIKLGIKCSMKKEKEHNDGIYRVPNKKLVKKMSYLLVPRSSISKTPLRMANSIGIIDSGYTGELMAMVDNHSDKVYSIKRGDRLFQVVRANLRPFSFKLVDELEKTERGDGGFGST
uniref:dUTP diphosphatase n=1 Tax=Pithovirus LCPAC101 TaxID=2506586 RepID=A0A481Z4R5_9VIRU|nr:MAG: dUTP diphosphatase [Pithovirus LCPAC101]